MLVTGLAVLLARPTPAPRTSAEPRRASEAGPARTPAAPLAAAATTPRPPEQPSALRDTERPPDEKRYFAELERLQRTDKQRALAYAERGEDWFSASGRGAEARRAMAVTLLVDLGRMDEARARTEEFLRHFPESPYRPLVQGVTGIHPRPGKPATAP